ncbi:MAG: orotidine-5'-phosphate decarboxylase [Bacteroidota bacterium]
MVFNQKLHAIQRKNNSLLCVGLDTDILQIPKFLLGRADPIIEFNRRIIEATQDLVCAYKLNLAFYEVLGERGWHIVHQTLARIPKNMITIGDGKRGDIGNSAERYAKLILEDYKFDAATVNPYMGKDCVTPFLKRKERCAFILTATSNKGAKDFQFLKVNGKPLYEKVLQKIHEWNTKKNCGVVAGTTHPRVLKRLRELAPAFPFLLPGIGAQQGDLESAVRYGCDIHGELAIISSSRSILYASPDENFPDAARAAALKLRDTINHYREKYF